MTDALPPSPWYVVTQDDVDAYSAATRDADWLHNDPTRARRDGAFGGTIVPGFMQLALLTGLITDVGVPGFPHLDLGETLNYGLDRARFVRPLLVGSRVRLRAELVGSEQKGDRLLMRMDVTLEVDDEDDRPSLSATWLFLLPQPLLSE